MCSRNVFEVSCHDIRFFICADNEGLDEYLNASYFPYIQVRRCENFSENGLTIFLKQIFSSDRLRWNYADDALDEVTVNLRDHYGLSSAITLGRDGSSGRVSLYYSELSSSLAMIARAIRAVALLLHYRAGRQFIHASAVGVRDKIVAFTGSKFSGKTTSMLAMCKYTDAVPCTNDKLAISSIAGGSIALGFPIKAGIRSGTADILRLSHSDLTGAVRLNSGDKVVRLSMQELARYYNKRVLVAGRLSLICIPIHDPDISGFNITKLNKNQIREQWYSNYFPHFKDIDPEQSVLDGLFGDYQAGKSITIPNVQFLLCKSNEGSIKSMMQNIYDLAIKEQV